MTTEELINLRTTLQQELYSLPVISLYNDNGEPDAEAYERSIKQAQLRDELKESLVIVNAQIEGLDLSEKAEYEPPYLE